jgi:O-antigen/teichoic acid export membrane protein
VPSPQNIYHSFIKGSIFIILGQLLIYLKGLIITPIIIKSVGSTIYGRYILLASFLGLVFGISSFGANFKYRRFLPSTKEMDRRNKLFYPQFFFHLLSTTILALLFYFLFPKIQNSFFKEEINFFVPIIIIWLIAYTSYSQTADYYRYTLKVGIFNIINISQPYLHILFIVILLYVTQGMNINLIFISQIAAIMLTTIPFLLRIPYEIGFKPVKININELIDSIKIGFPLVIGFIIDFILNAGDRYIIALFLTIEKVAYYSAAYTLGSLIILFPKAISVILPQLLSKSYDNNREDRVRTMLNYSVKGFYMLCIPFIIGGYLMGKPILTIYSNAKIADNSYYLIPLVGLGILFYGFSTIFSNMLFVKMKTKEIFKVNMMAAILNIILNTIFIFLFKSIVVAALTTIISYFFSFIYIYLLVSKDWCYNFDFIGILKCILASLLMGVCLVLIKPFFSDGNSLLLMVQILIGMIIYGKSLFLINFFSKKELLFIKQIFIKIE